MLTKTEQLEKTLKRARLLLSGQGHASPAFVFGAQRSGTDMTASVFAKCSSAESYYESDPEAFDNFVLHDFETVTRLTTRSRAKVVFFKCILNSQSASILLDLHPEAKAIWLFRAYPDVVNSNLKRFKQHFADLDEMINSPETAGWRVENVTPEDMELVRKYYAKGVSDASARALLWLLRNRLLFQQHLEHDPRVLIANYDRIVMKPSENFAKIFTFFGLPFEPRFVKDVRATSIGKEPPRDIDPEIGKLCDEMFERLDAVAAL